MSYTIQFSHAFKELFRKAPQPYNFTFEPNHQTVKHFIEFLGIPHTEVGSIRSRNVEVSFSHRPQHGEQIQVEPFEGSAPVQIGSLLRKPYLELKFIVDECVASLAPKLRMLGLDTVFDRRWDDPAIAKISASEERVVLTRDRGLLMRKEIIWGRFVRAKDPQEQLKEVMQFFSLKPLPNALQRCLVCNGHLLSVNKKDISDQLGPKTKFYFDDFSQCSDCQKIYWEGSHFEKMKESLNEISAETGST